MTASIILVKRNRLAASSRAWTSETLDEEENGEIQASRFGPVPSGGWKWLLTNNECTHGMLQISLSAPLVSLENGLRMFRI